VIRKLKIYWDSKRILDENPMNFKKKNCSLLSINRHPHTNSLPPNFLKVLKISAARTTAILAQRTISGHSCPTRAINKTKKNLRLLLTAKWGNPHLAPLKNICQTLPSIKPKRLSIHLLVIPTKNSTTNLTAKRSANRAFVREGTVRCLAAQSIR
jgi:hypothetical protein